MSAKKKEKLEVDLMLKSAWLAISKIYTELAHEYEATAVQALTLLKIDPKNGTRSTNLGPKMAIEPTSLTRIIKILEDDGYIYKDKSTKDKREVIIKLTDKGMEHRNISKDIVVGLNEKIIKKIPQDKLIIFEEVINSILEAVQEARYNYKL